MPSSVPVIDLRPWFGGGEAAHAAVEADHDAVIESLRRPIGRPNDLAPVVSAQFLKERLDAITIG
jgi:hypothetical protein